MSLLFGDSDQTTYNLVVKQEFTCRYVSSILYNNNKKLVLPPIIDIPTNVAIT